jgi:S-adenosylmethionine/arginine decarboxylase-like enzyme
MVQIYNPNVVGKHILIDIKNVNSDKLKLVEDMKAFLDKIVEELKLNVVGECSHQFKKDNSPYGATMIYLLSESHLSVHTFVDEGKITLDLFTCDISLDDKNLKNIIGDYFGVSRPERIRRGKSRTARTRKVAPQAPAGCRPGPASARQDRLPPAHASPPCGLVRGGRD